MKIFRSEVTPMKAKLWCEGSQGGKQCGEPLRHYAHSVDAEVEGDESCEHEYYAVIDASGRIYNKCCKCGHVPDDLRLR
jgi:hypothetical protein